MFGICCITLEQQNKYFSQKSGNFEDINFLSVIYKSLTKNPKTLSKFEKVLAEKKDNCNRVY